jgi:hypothetical protein
MQFIYCSILIVKPGVKKRNGTKGNETVLTEFFQKRNETKRKIFEKMRNEKKRNEIQRNETETKKLDNVVFMLISENPF